MIMIAIFIRFRVFKDSSGNLSNLVFCLDSLALELSE